MPCLLRVAAFALAGVLLAAGCVSDGVTKDARPRPAESVEEFHARVAATREAMAAGETMAARIAALNGLKQWLRERTGAYERAIVAGEEDPAAQPLYEDMRALLVTLNNVPDAPFSPDYCDIVRNSIHFAWAPQSPNPDPDALPGPVREGLALLDLVCGA